MSKEIKFNPDDLLNWFNYQFPATQGNKTVEQISKDYAQLTAENARLREELQKKFPNIGADPLKLNGQERSDYMEKAEERLFKASAIQQKEVPDQTCLCWRWDVSHLSGELSLYKARYESLKTQLQKSRLDGERLDWLCRYWDSEKEVNNFKLKLENPTGSFRDAIDSAIAASKEVGK